MGICRGCFRSPWAKPQLRDSVNSKSAAKQHDLCSLLKYHSTLFTKNREEEQKALSVCSASLVFLIHWLCIVWRRWGLFTLKATGLKKKTLCTRPASCLSRVTTFPPFLTAHRPGYRLWHLQKRVDIGRSVWKWACHLRGFSAWLICFRYHPLKHTTMMAEVRSHGTEQNQRIALHWK